MIRLCLFSKCKKKNFYQASIQPNIQFLYWANINCQSNENRVPLCSTKGAIVYTCFLFIQVSSTDVTVVYLSMCYVSILDTNIKPFKCGVRMYKSAFERISKNHQHARWWPQNSIWFLTYFIWLWLIPVNIKLNNELARHVEC